MSKWLQRKQDGFVSNERVFISVFMLALAIPFALAFKKAMNTAEETHHNVQILEHPAKNLWYVVDDEQPKRWLYVACNDNDFPNDKYIVAGYVAYEARWRVEDGCLSIAGITEDGKERGFFYYRNLNTSGKTIAQMKGQ